MMSRIKFIYEVRQKQILIAFLAALILVLAVIGISIEGDLRDFALGLAFGISLIGLFLFIKLFLNKHFVYGNDKYLIIRINSFFFKTILLNQIDSVEATKNKLHIHLSNKSIDINLQGINQKDMKSLETILSKFAEKKL